MRIIFDSSNLKKALLPAFLVICFNQAEFIFADIHFKTQSAVSACKEYGRVHLHPEPDDTLLRYDDSG
jgi:hypothetical protein